MRGIILAGGKGTRLANFTNTINKHIAPIYSPTSADPMIYNPISTLVKSGITDILIISSQEHSGSIIEVLGDGDKFGCDFTYKIQDMNNPLKPVGIASALKLAEKFIGDSDSPFAVILGDNYYQDTFKDEFTEFELSYKKCKEPTSSIFLKSVHDPERFGVATVDKKEVYGSSNRIKVNKIVEKPKVPESNYAVTGLYLYTPHVFSIVPTLTVSDRGELEITDINNWYVNNNGMTAYELSGFWHDSGTVFGIHEIESFLWNMEKDDRTIYNQYRP